MNLKVRLDRLEQRARSASARGAGPPAPGRPAWRDDPELVAQASSELSAWRAQREAEMLAAGWSPERITVSPQTPMGGGL